MQLLVVVGGKVVQTRSCLTRSQIDTLAHGRSIHFPYASQFNTLARGNLKFDFVASSGGIIFRCGVVFKEENHVYYNDAGAH